MSFQSLLWADLCKQGKWEECAAIIQKELTDSLVEVSDNGDRHTQRILLGNNLFVCNQLNKNWDNKTEMIASQDWAQSYLEVSDLWMAMRCQQICTGVPLDLVLSVTYNSVWWACMKVDSSNQHFCFKDALKQAVFAFKSVGNSLGVWNLEEQMTGLIETDFTVAVSTLVPFLTKLPPTLCQLTLEIIIMGCLVLLDNQNIQLSNNSIDLQNGLLGLVDCLPQLKIHFSYDHEDVANVDNLMKFGWWELGLVLSRNKTSSILETFLIVKAIFMLRITADEIKEEISKVLEVLNVIDKNNLTFPFLYYYLHAFVNLKLGNLDHSLYHLQHAISSSSNFFMQSRANILKGQILLLKGSPDLALQSLLSVEYKRKEVRIPLCAYLIGTAYQSLGKFRQQIDILNLLLECLSVEAVVEPKLLSPMVGMEHRLLLSVHTQPEVTYEEVLQSCAEACLSNQQPKEAAEKFLELLQVISLKTSDEDISSPWKISQLLHDTASALLEADYTSDAQNICEAALEFHLSALDLRKPATLDFCSLNEDVIALMLLAEAKDKTGASDVSDILTRSAKLLQNLHDKGAKVGETLSEITSLSKALLARVFLHKAMLNLRRQFEDDATACFQRALHWKNDDPEVILQFAYHLLETRQTEESLALWIMYKDSEHSSKKTNSIALNYLLGQKLSHDLREEITCRLQALDSSN